MSVSLVHHCIDQKRIVRGSQDPPAKRGCRCRKFISLRDATKLVKDNEARWAVTKRVFVETSIDCTLCFAATDVEKKTCANCKGTGKLTVRKDESEHGNDIVLMSQDGAVYEKPKTPRTATVESKHLERAYKDALVESLPSDEDLEKIYQDGFIKGRKKQWDRPNAARERIEMYGNMIAQNLASIGAELKEDGKVTREGRPEPADSWQRGEGYNFDKGWGVMRICAFEGGAEIEDPFIKDKPSLDGQKNFEASQSRERRLAELMKEIA